MESNSCNQINKYKDELSLQTWSKTSPVTDLALNMQCLSTSISCTPNRRISWSNPFPTGDKKSALDSPFVDSPTFQVISTCASKDKTKYRKVIKNMLTQENEDKENVSPELTKYPQDNLKELESVSDSQDSGYSGLSYKFPENSVGTTPNRSTERSTISMDEEEEGFDGIFRMDDDEEESEIVALPNNMTNLLTKPLHQNSRNKNEISAVVRNVKPPARRCLSKEMDFEFAASTSVSHENVSENCSLVAANTSGNEDHMDVESLKIYGFKRPNPPDYYFSLQNKRRKSSASVDNSPDIFDKTTFVLQRSFSETATTIMQAIQKSDLCPDLIGDCSKLYALPLVKGQHQDLKSISPETLVQVLKGEYINEISSYTLVDCRYPYEYDGGHIHGAKNIYTKEEIVKAFLHGEPSSARNVIIFHCEFSSERAPSMCRFLRQKDRELNSDQYPRLNHPEIYLLEGGYKAFFKEYKEYCEPQEYKPMNHKDHNIELRHFRAKSKSWGADSKARCKLRLQSLPKI